MTIRTPDELIQAILSDRFTDAQIKQIIERALTVLFIYEVPPREKLAEMVRDFFLKYPDKYEKPIFFDLEGGALDVQYDNGN